MPDSPQNLSGPIHVLLVSSKEGVRQYLASVLEGSSFHVECRGTFAEAREVISGESLDVVLFVGEPEDEPLAAFVADCHRAHPHMGLVMLHEKPGTETPSSTRELGLDLVLSLPVKAVTLREQIEEICLRQRARAKSALAIPQILLRQLERIHMICEDVLQEDDLDKAFTAIAESLSELPSGDTVGLLAVDSRNEWHMVLHSRTPMSLTRCDSLRDTLFDQRDLLESGTLLRENVRVRVAGEIRTAGEENPGEWVVAPMIARRQLQGIIALAKPPSLRLGRIQAQALHQTAAHLSTLLLAQRKMRHLAIHDPLTHCFNRRHLNTELPVFCQRAAAAKRPLGVLLLDVDYFKDINDTLGHACGDQTLVEFHRIIRNIAAPSHLIFRLGGDEFLVLLPETTRDEAADLASRIHETLRNHSFRFEDRVLRITGSGGLSVAIPANKPLAHNVFLDRADKALYISKRNGRDRFTFWEKLPKSGESAPEDAGFAEIAESPRKMGKILLVDDEPLLLEVITRGLQGLNLDILTARNVAEAEDLLRSHNSQIDILMTDISMPGRDGFELLALSKEITPLTIRIMVTGNVTTDNAISAIRSGTYDFLQKPFSRQQLVALVHRAMEYRRLLVENHEYQHYLEEMVRKKNSELAGRLNEVRDAYDFSLDAMVAMLDAWEQETSRHSQRVMELTCVLATQLKVQEPALSQYLRGALLHDIGKIGVPNRILSKPGALTDAEWKLMREHPVIGHRFIQNCSFLGEAMDIVLCHHEAYDGSGYPQGLTGEAIPLGARIFSVIDAYDTMRSPRVYKSSIPMEQACAEIRRQSGKQFDPGVVEAFFEVLPEIEDLGRWDILSPPPPLPEDSCEDIPAILPKLRLKNPIPEIPRESRIPLPGLLQAEPPSPKVVLQLKPKSFEEHRDSKRLPLEFPAMLNESGRPLKNQFRAVIRGPSLNGVGLVANQPIPNNAELDIFAETSVLGEKNNCRLRGKVVWTRSKVGTLIYEAGVELIPKKCLDHKMWTLFVLNRLRALTS